MVVTADNVRRWQRAVGYMPEYVYLIDDTAVANITFGLPLGEIDRKDADRAVRIATLHQFIVGGVLYGYNTRTGERRDWQHINIVARRWSFSIWTRRIFSFVGIFPL